MLDTTPRAEDVDYIKSVESTKLGEMAATLYYRAKGPKVLWGEATVQAKMSYIADAQALVGVMAGGGDRLSEVAYNAYRSHGVKAEFGAEGEMFVGCLCGYGGKLVMNGDPQDNRKLHVHIAEEIGKAYVRGVVTG